MTLQPNLILRRLQSLMDPKYQLSEIQTQKPAESIIDRLPFETSEIKTCTVNCAKSYKKETQMIR